MRLRVNILCICGFVVAMTAILSPWMVRTFYFDLPPYAPPSISEQFNIDIVAKVDDVDSLAAALYVLGAWLFVLGAGLSLWTTLSGFLQSGGLAAYLVGGYSELFFERTAERSYEAEPGIGVVLGAIGAALIVASFIRPVFVGRRLEGSDEGETRLLVWVIARKPPVEPTNQ